MRAKRSGHRNLLKYFLFKFRNLNCHLVWWLIWCIWVLLLFADSLIKFIQECLSCFLPSSHLRPPVHDFYKDFTSSWKIGPLTNNFSGCLTPIKTLLSLASRNEDPRPRNLLYRGSYKRGQTPQEQLAHSVVPVSLGKTSFPQRKHVSCLLSDSPPTTPFIRISRYGKVANSVRNMVCTIPLFCSAFHKL